RVGRIARRGRADRAQVGGAGGGAVRRRLRLLARGFLTRRLLACGFLAGRLLARGFLAGRLFAGRLLRDQLPRRLLLGQSLLFLALAFKLLLALDFLLGRQLLLRRAAGGLGLCAGDRGLEPVDGGIGRIGLF